MERTDLAVGLGALALVISAGVAIQSLSQKGSKTDELQREDVRNIASSLDEKEPKDLENRSMQVLQWVM